VPKSSLTVESVKQSLAFEQPYLSVVELNGIIRISGSFIVAASKGDAADGAIDQYAVLILVAKDFPHREPIVFETGDRIPREVDRHCYTNGACCTGVWDEWRVRDNSPTVGAFLEGPVRNFFLSQIYFENHGRWPFGERSHGEAGIREACADLLGIKDDQKLLMHYLRVLAGPWPKGHWQCPCVSSRQIRHCHRDELMALHTRIPFFVARRLFNKLKVKSQVLRRLK
jgi:hypothetical protein